MVKILNGLSFIVMMFSILFNTIDASLLKDAPEAKSETELAVMQNIFDDYELSDEITVINLGELSLSQRHTIIFLQGLVAREKPSIFIDYGSASHKYALSEMEKAGYAISRTDDEGNPWKFESIIKKFSSYIKDSGYILYKTTEDHGQINTATNLATIYGWLPVTPELEESVISLGLTKKKDISNDEIDLEYLKEFYEEHKDSFSKNSLVHLYHYASGMRDFAIQQNIFVIYIEDSDFTGRLFRDKIMRELTPSSIIFGWCQYEIKFTQSASRFGHTVIPSDHSYNLSILSCFDATEEEFSTTLPENVELDPEKHYVSIVYSDGDNAQWIQNGFSEYHTWQSYNEEKPVSWTFCPLLTEISEVDIKRTLDIADNTAFITGPTGGGYSRIMHMGSDELEAFSDYTAAVMKESGIGIMTLLDTIKGNEKSFFKSMEKRLSYFSRYDNIEGGILQLDPDNYSGGKGRVMFLNDKPFICVGFSLWYPSGNAEEVTEDWLIEQAAIINGKSADINSINGYTVINVHPWTVGPDDLQIFVDNLGENIEVITIDKLLAAVKENIPHETAVPGK
ncbi:MAG: hypothetical protein IJN70_06150 [Clostridia bacterium]|nr:hypothetical protein [Clostridia bacterium]